jgi:ATP-binding cassette, subfamily B, bacterial
MSSTSPIAAMRSSDRPKSRELARLSAIARYLKPYRLQIAGALVALVAAAATVLGLGQGLRILMDKGFSAGNTELLNQALVLMIGVTTLLAIATYARYTLVSWLGERITADLRRDVFDNLMRLSPIFFETTRSGEVLSRLTTDTTVLQVVVGSSASMALRNLLLFVGGTAMMVVTSAKLTGLAFLIVPLVLVPLLAFGRQVRKLSRVSQDRIADLSADANETLQEIRTVQAFGHEAIDRDRFAGRVEAAFSTAVSRIRSRGLLTGLIIFLVFAAVSVILWLGGHDVLAGRLSGGELMAFVFYAITVAAAAAAISEVYGDLQRAAGAMGRLQELLAAEPSVAPPVDPLPLPAPPRGEVRFRALRFAYPSRPDAPALEGIDLAIAPGETVAIVGPSGAGKTTLFQLLLRFYDPDGGAVEIDGVDVRRAALGELRSRIGLVPQEPVLFSMSLRENIRYGRPEAGDAEVEAAAAAAHIVEFLPSLPQGYASELGERGVRLSGGQRQRVAIARAVLRNPAVLLLDEATSALDAESERVVQAALDRLMAGRTTLVIAHRLATVLKADRIVVLDRGRIVAIGRHAELMREDGLYRRLAQLQFDRAETAPGEALAPAAS